MGKLYRRPDSPYWWLCFHDGHQVQRRSMRSRDRKAAEARAREYERAAADPRHAAAHKTSLRAAFERLLMHCEQRGRAEATIEFYRKKAGHIVRVLGEDTPLARVNARLVDDYVDTRTAEGAAPNTIAKELTTFRMALKLAKRRGEFPLDLGDVMPVGFSPKYKPRKRALKDAVELRRLVEHLPVDRAAHACFLVATAARWGESVRARREDIRLASSTVYVRGTKTDAAEDAIPIVGWMEVLLEEVLAVSGEREGLLFRPWSNVRRDLAQACEAAKIDPITPNDLRRTLATWMRAAGVEPSLIARLLRHTDGRMVERVYGRITAEAAGDLLRRRLREAGVADSNRIPGQDEQGGQQIPEKPVPRDRIELPTRGFSIGRDLTGILRGKKGARRAA